MVATVSKNETSSSLIINHKIEQGLEEARELGSGCDDLEGPVESQVIASNKHPEWKEAVKIEFEVIFIEVKFMAQNDCNFWWRTCSVDQVFDS